MPVFTTISGPASRHSAIPISTSTTVSACSQSIPTSLQPTDLPPRKLTVIASRQNTLRRNVTENCARLREETERQRQHAEQAERQRQLQPKIAAVTQTQSLQTPQPKEDPITFWVWIAQLALGAPVAVLGLSYVFRDILATSIRSL